MPPFQTRRGLHCSPRFSICLCSDDHVFLIASRESAAFLNIGRLQFLQTFSLFWSSQILAKDANICLLSHIPLITACGGALPWRRQDGGAAQAVTEGLSKFATAQAQQPSRLASSAPSHASRPCVTSAALVRRCASGGQQFCLHMQNCQLMRARTPHCGAAHNAHIRPLHREGFAHKAMLSFTL